MRDQADPMTSTKPYLVRAIYEWILDNQMTPQLLVDARYPEARVPAEFVADGRIVLNITPTAVRELHLGNDWISFSARFGGNAREVLVPAEAVLGIFTRENGKGMLFPESPIPVAPEPPPQADTRVPEGDIAGRRRGNSKGKGGGPKLKVVK